MPVIAPPVSRNGAFNFKREKGMKRNYSIAKIDRESFIVVLKRKKRDVPVDRIKMVTVLAKNKKQAEAAAKFIHPGWRVDEAQPNHVIRHRSKA